VAAGGAQLAPAAMSLAGEKPPADDDGRAFRLRHEGNDRE
jgi:hypothetical protein